MHRLCKIILSFYPLLPSPANDQSITSGETPSQTLLASLTGKKKKKAVIKDSRTKLWELCANLGRFCLSPIGFLVFILFCTIPRGNWGGNVYTVSRVFVLVLGRWGKNSRDSATAWRRCSTTYLV